MADLSQNSTVQLLGQLCGASQDEVSKAADAGSVATVVSVCQQLARSSSQTDQLLGAQPGHQAQILQWLTWCSSELSSSVTDEKLSAVDHHLASTTFLAGGCSLSLADVVAYGILHQAVSTLPAAQSTAFINLLRWFDLVQNLVAQQLSQQQQQQQQQVFSRVSIALPAFEPLPPPTPANSRAATASSASAATGQGASKKDKAAPAAAAAAAAAPSNSSSTSTTAAAAAPDTNQQQQQPQQAKESSAKDKQSKKEKKEKKPEAAAAAGGNGSSSSKKDSDELRIDMIDIRVGTIVSVKQHPNADALYLEKIDLGEEKPRQVISGLVKFVPVDQMQGRRVVVCCNLKPAKMRDIMSHGMVLCASNDDHTVVDPIVPPEGVPNGERITFEGFSNAPLDEVNPKRKILERLFPDLTTYADGIPTYKGVPFMTSKGPVTSAIPNAHVA